MGRVFFLKIALQDQFFSLMGVVIPLDLANNTTHLKKNTQTANLENHKK